MALIEKAQGRKVDQSPSGYTRLFGISTLGNLISKVHAACISAGTELERFIWERVNQISDLDKFITETLHKKEDSGKIWVAIKRQIKQSKTINSKYEPDFIAFDLKLRMCYVIEVKDGDQFDTKKASGEHNTLHNFTNDISHDLPFSTRIFMCCFHARNIEEMYIGLKGKFSKDELMTGKDLCLLLGIDYDEIIKIRTSDQQRNLDYFINSLLYIDTIKNMIKKRLGIFKI
ncbi:MAG: restriction endonuclease [Actinomycetota bacterium]|nr:restriction endonuclease [Actinomycetota bacterium]